MKIDSNMKVNEVLKGRIVMVSPYGDENRLIRLGQVGKIMRITPDDGNVVLVKFGDCKVYAYHSDDLLTLVSKKKILENMASLQKGATRLDNIPDMLKIYRLANSNQIQEALKLAVQNDTTRMFCIMDCHAFRDTKLRQLAYLKKEKKRKI